MDNYEDPKSDGSSEVSRVLTIREMATHIAVRLNVASDAKSLVHEARIIEAYLTGEDGK